MKRVERILYPVDFSEHCAKVGREVFFMARQLGAEVNVLHVANDESSELRTRLDAFIEDLPDDVSVTSSIRPGTPARVILETAQALGVDFIAMPTRGLSGWKSMLFGSVTERVLHKAEHPVWTEGLVAEGTTRLESILCAVDLGPNSLNVIRWAQMLAEHSGARYRILHVGHGDNSEAELRRLAGKHAECVLHSGLVDAVIFEEAERIGADLIVMGRGEERNTLGRFRNIAQTIIQRSPCAVLSV
jgi:nucleotide-binding universal stress UspA family protein